MSDLGQQIQDEIDAIDALQTKAETPAGQDGDPWSGPYEAFVDAVQRQLDAAASQTALDAKPDSDTQLSESEVKAALVAQSILNGSGTVTSDVDNDLTTTQELSVSDNSPTTGVAGTTGDIHIIGQVDMGSGKPTSITATSWNTFIFQVGAVDLKELTTNTTLKVRFAGNIGNGTAGESIAVRPIIGSMGPITPLKITSENASEMADSGWVDLSQSPSEGIQPISYQAKVSGSSGLAWPNLTLFIGREIK